MADKDKTSILETLNGGVGSAFASIANLNIRQDSNNPPIRPKGKKATASDVPFNPSAPAYDATTVLKNSLLDMSAAEGSTTTYNENAYKRATEFGNANNHFGPAVPASEPTLNPTVEPTPTMQNSPITDFSVLKDNVIVPKYSNNKEMGINSILELGSDAIPNEDAVMRQDLGLYTTSFPNQRINDDERKADGAIRTYQNYFQNFNRYYNIYNDLEMSGLHSYVFITRPDLYIFRDDASEVSPLAGNKESVKDIHGKTTIMYSPKFIYMSQFHNIILRQLTAGFSKMHHFIPFLFDRTMSLQLTDTNIKEYSTKQLYTGYSFKYAGHGQESHSGSGEFSIQFREDSQLRVTKLFSIWEEYIDGVARGLFRPKDQYIYLDQLDYVCSVYEIITAPDGESILYWAKYTGCFPTNVNHSNFSHGIGVGTGMDNKVDISFAFSHFDALDPAILTDFNKNVPQTRKIARSAQVIDVGVAEDGSHSRWVLPHYDPEILTGRPIAGPPFIALTSGGYNYKLIWTPPVETQELFK